MPPLKSLLPYLSPAHSIRIRLVLVVLVVEMLILSLMAMNNLRLLTHSMTAQARQYIEGQAPVLSAAVLAPLLQQDYATIQSILDEGRAHSSLLYLAVNNAEGQQVAISGQAPTKGSGTDGALEVSLFGPRQDRHDVSVPIAASGTPLGELKIGLDISNIWQAIDQLMRDGLRILLLGMGVSALLLMGLLHLTVTRHMSAIAQGIRQLQEGNYQHRFVQRTSDELGVLAHSLNYMSGRVQQAFEALRQAKIDEEERLSVKVEQRTAALETANAQLTQTLSELRTTQSQLVQAEKMASLGQLVANVAHEINTPLGAVKSSGHNIADALSRMLKQLPEVLVALDGPQRRVFLALIAAANRPLAVMSTREERHITRQLAQQLETLGLSDARHKAELLVQLRAHENPNLVLGLLQHDAAERILAAAADVATLVHSSDNINTAVERASKIVFALKCYAHTEPSSEPRPADLRQGMDTVLTLYQHQFKQGVELQYQADELPPVNCLPDELNQVWTNLIHNALHAMQHRGTLSVELSQQGTEVRVSIGDSGTGIPEVLHARLFEPFFTTKPAGEGSGLGLNIVRQIVTRHGGRIDFSTALGVGTTFNVWLPMAGTKA
jgi:signal transduction histidine kinase